MKKSHHGSLVLEEMVAEVGKGINSSQVRHAIAINRKFGRNIGWQSSAWDIAQRILNLGPSYKEEDFVGRVMQWQRANGLKSDGIIGFKTWAKMKEELDILDLLLLNRTP